MADGNGAAVDVKTVVGNAEPVAAINDLHCKGFVQFPEADVVDLEIKAIQELGNRENRADAHLVRLCACHGHAAIAAKRLKAASGCEACFHQHAGRGAIGKLARISGGDEAVLPNRFERGEALKSRVWTVAFVAFENHFLH